MLKKRYWDQTSGKILHEDLWRSSLFD